MTLDLFLLSLANGRGSWVQVVVVGVGVSTSHVGDS